MNATKRGIGILIYSIIISFVLVFNVVFSLKTQADSNIQTSEDRISINLINEIRANDGVAPLKWSDDLSQAAADKARDIVDHNYFDHVSPTGKTAWDFVLAEKYDYKYAGENLAIDFPNVTDATVAWKNSPSHYANIINGKYTEFGFAEIVGNVQGKQSKIYVEMFGSRMSVRDRILTVEEGGSDVN